MNKKKQRKNTTYVKVFEIRQSRINISNYNCLRIDFNFNICLIEMSIYIYIYICKMYKRNAFVR